MIFKSLADDGSFFIYIIIKDTTIIKKYINIVTT